MHVPVKYRASHSQERKSRCPWPRALSPIWPRIAKCRLAIRLAGSSPAYCVHQSPLKSNVRPAEMSLYVLVHHRSQPDPPYDNDWLDRDEPNPWMLAYIFTKPYLARACELERLAGNRVYIHRCKFGPADRRICANAAVVHVDLVSDRVTFGQHRSMDVDPPRRAKRGQISYRA